jgi:hypothetical protein
VVERLIRVLHVDEASRVAHARRPDDLGAEERRNDHRVPERERPAVGQAELAGEHLLDGDVEDGLDAGHPEEHLEHPLAAGETADAEVTGERLRGDVVERRPLLKPVSLQLIGRVEGELVRRAEAGRSLRRGDDDRTGLVHEPRPPLGGVHRAVERRDRIRIPARPQTGDDVEVVHETGGDDELVVAHTPGRLDLSRRRIDLDHLGVDVLEPCSSSIRAIGTEMSRAVLFPNGTQMSEG